MNSQQHEMRGEFASTPTSEAVSLVAHLVEDSDELSRAIRERLDGRDHFHVDRFSMDLGANAGTSFCEICGHAVGDVPWR